MFTVSTRRAAALAFLLTAFSACSDGGGGGGNATGVDRYAVANQCWAIAAEGAYLARGGAGDLFAFTAADAAAATPFFLKPADLGTYLLYDDGRGFVVSDGIGLQRALVLESDITRIEDGFESDGEWVLEGDQDDRGPFRLRHRKSARYLTSNGLGGLDQAAEIGLTARDGCAQFPEERTHASGTVRKGRFDDGAVFGFVDAHSHILANFGFGGGGIFHGAPFHRLGVEHALGSCERFHAAEGRADLFGAGFDGGINLGLDVLLQTLATKRLPNFNHFTEGYPEFKTWPAAPFSSTHQVQYYKWLERAYLGGLRLVVQHAVSNQMICDLLGRGGFQPLRYDCYDMVAVDRQLVEIYNMQDYIDAQSGGPGQGWFRIVTSPAEAREVIGGGKMAVILGIETSNLFDCPLTPRVDGPTCDPDYVRERLAHYRGLGVRAMFPVHKYDNQFSAGDGNKGFIELGNLVQTGHFANFTTDCDVGVPTVFDGGPMTFPGLNDPRVDFLAPAPNDFSRFYENPIATLAPLFARLTQPPIPGEDTHCQRTGLTELGEFLLEEMIANGMIIEVDHLPRRAYKRAYELLEEYDYPAAGTHGLDNYGKLYRLGGVSTSGFSTCRTPGQSATVDDGFQARLALMRENGGYPGLGFGLDLNGFAGAAGPRFGARSRCSAAQSDPLGYPFTSFAGDVTFEPPSVGNRALDFNTEGLVHIGLLPELIEDVRRDGVTDADIEPLFRSAEAYLRMWEKAEARAAALRR